MTPKTQMTRWNPFGEWEDFRNLAKTFLARPDGGTAEVDTDWTPAVDVTEDDKEYTITADLPDVTKDNVKVTVNEGMLTIQGERRHEEEEKKKKYHRIERSFGRYTRSFMLPKEVDPAKIEARFDAGVLKVHLPKSVEVKAPTQEIPVG